jgi:pimeloyl-ACP methyl ester carboxylesterase
MNDGGVVNAIHFEVPNARGVVFYLKGNSRSIKGWGKFAKDFLGKGYDFFMMDYRGFGKSSGKRTEQILYSDSLELYDILTGEYTDDEIVVYGRSFGSGVAAYVASKRTPKMLILDSPYYTFRYQIGRFGGWMPLKFLLKYQIPTIKYLEESNCPAYVIHGDRDFIISYEQGVRLTKESDAELITIKGGRHNNLPQIAQFQEELYRILKEG